MSSSAAPRKARTAKVVGALVSVLILVLVFAFLFPKFADYGQALDQIAAMPPWWIIALVAASIANIVIYPFTEIAAIPSLPYRAAFMSRQSAFTISNIVPGGGAVAVATQYAVLAGYRVPPAAAAAAVSADGVFTYLITLGAPSIAIGLLLIEGDSITGFGAAAIVGLVIVVVSVIVIAAVLRSEASARRIGGWAQRPANALWRLFRKQAPDISAALATFNEHASEMIGERWRSLFVTNLGAQFAPVLVLLVAMGALGISPHPVTIIEAFAAFTIALVLTMFPLTPGGLGTVDAALVALLVGFGADSSVALAVDLVWRLAWFLPQLLVGLVALGIYRWDVRKAARAQPS